MVDVDRLPMVSFEDAIVVDIIINSLLKQQPLFSRERIINLHHAVEGSNNWTGLFVQ